MWRHVINILRVVNYIVSSLQHYYYYSRAVAEVGDGELRPHENADRAAARGVVRGRDLEVDQL